MSDRHIRALRDAARRARGRLADHTRNDAESTQAGQRGVDLERASRRAAARLAAAEGRRRREQEDSTCETTRCPPAPAPRPP